jgi:hypothetical protein
MAGDKGGWLQAVWVVVMGAVMAMAIWLCDRMFPPFLVPFSSLSTLPPNSDFESVRSSLHQPLTGASLDAIIDQEA